MKGIEEFKQAMSKLNNGLQRQVHRYLASLAADIKAEARRRVPVRTGYLQSKIYVNIKEWVINLGADTTYAYFVELGTRYMRAHPYLWPAIQQYLPQLESVIVEAIKVAKSEAGLR